MGFSILILFSVFLVLEFDILGGFWRLVFWCFLSSFWFELRCLGLV